METSMMAYFIYILNFDPFIETANKKKPDHTSLRDIRIASQKIPPREWKLGTRLIE